MAVLPPNNRTGNELLVAGTGLIDRYVIRAEQVTVPDVLLSEARFQLQQKGFDVTGRPAVDAALKGRTPTSPASAAELASAGGLKNLVLYLELRRWEGDAPMHTSFVIVGLQATLIDPITGKMMGSKPPGGAGGDARGDAVEMRLHHRGSQGHRADAGSASADLVGGNASPGKE